MLGTGSWFKVHLHRCCAKELVGGVEPWDLQGVLTVACEGWMLFVLLGVGPDV